MIRLKCSKMQIYRILLLAVVCSCYVSSVGSSDIAYENPCDRMYPVPGYFTDGSSNSSECIDSCVIEGRSVSALYQGTYCFCGESINDEYGTTDSIPTLTDGPVWLCNNQTANSFLLINQTYAVPSVSLVFAARDGFDVDYTVDLLDNRTSDGVVVEFVSSDSVSHVIYDVSVDRTSIMTAAPAIKLRTHDAVEVDAYIYRQPFMESLETNQVDCVLSGHCQRHTFLLPKVSVDVTMDMSCDEYIWANETFNCDVTVYGEAANLYVDFGDGNTDQMAPSGSKETVVGYKDIYYINASDSEFTSSATSVTYLLTHQVINKPGMIYAWEYTYTAHGVFEFSVHRPNCGDQYYCHKSVSCVADELACLSTSSRATRCPPGSMWSLSERECVLMDSGSPAFGDAVNRDVGVPNIPYVAVSTTTIDTSTIDESPSSSAFHRTSSSIMVEAGDVIGVKATSGSVAVVNITGNQQILCLDPSISTCDLEPLVAAHMYTAFTYAASNTYVEDCQDFAIQVVAQDSDLISLSENATVRPLSRLSNVTISTSSPYDPIPDPDGHEDVVVLAQDEDFNVTVPWHPAYCDSIYYIQWGDSGDTYDRMTGKSASYVYTSADSYNITLLTETKGINTTTTLRVLVQAKIQNLRFSTIESATIFGQSTDFDVSYDQGSAVNLHFSAGDGHEEEHAETVSAVSFSYQYPQHGYYKILINASNLVSTETIEFWMPVEVVITDLSISDDLIPYNTTSPAAVHLNIVSGTRVNFTCTIDGAECISCDLDSGNLGGPVYFGPSDISGPGDYTLSCSAINMVSAKQEVSMVIYVLRPIADPEITVITPYGTDDFLVQPYDAIKFNTSFAQGSHVTLAVDCEGAFQDEVYEEEIIDGEMSITNAFSYDAVFKCLLSLTSPIGNNVTRQYTFIAQYPVKDVEFAMAAFDSSKDPEPEEIAILTSPGYSEDLVFILYRPSGVNLPTNCSWSVDYGDGQTDSPGTFLEDIGNASPSYTLTARFTHTYTVGGNYTITISLSNDFSGELNRTIDVVVYEEISGLKIDSIVHIDGNGNTWPSFPNEGNPYSAPLLGISLDKYYQIEETLQFNGSVVRGSHTTWKWVFGTDVTEGADCGSVEYNYLNIEKPGKRSVTLVVSNYHNTLTVSEAIVLQISVQNVLLTSPPAFTFPKNTTVDWMLHGNNASDACYLIDFKDSTAVESRYFAESENDLCEKFFTSVYENVVPGKLSDLTSDYLTFNISMKFMKLGQYEVEYHVVNMVSSDVASYRVGITRGPCEFPEIDFSHHSCIDCDTFPKSAAVAVKAAVKIACPDRNITSTWTVYNMTDSGEDLLSLSSTQYSSKLERITVQPRVLGYGRYRFELNVSMDDEVDIYTVESVEITVIPSELEAKLDRGPVIPIKFGDLLQLNGSSSFDPDEGPDASTTTGLTFTWLCHRICENLPEYDSDWKEVSNMTKACRDEEYKPGRPEDRGCFHDDNITSSGLFTDDGNSEIRIYTNSSYEMQKIVITLYVQKGDRFSKTSALVDITKGNPPQVSIRCVINCQGKTNTDVKFSFKSVLLSGLSSDHAYSWIFYNASAGPIDWSNPNLIPLPVDDTMLANTGTKDNSVAFVANSQYAADPFTKKLAIKLEVTKIVTNSSAWQTADIEFNNPPIKKVGGCKVEPEEGVSMETIFDVICDKDAFLDEDEPLEYQYFVNTDQSADAYLISGKSTTLGPINGFKLAFGLERYDYMIQVIVRCSDKYGSFSELPIAVRVLPQNKPLAESLKDMEEEMQNVVQQELENGNYKAAANKLLAQGPMLNIDGPRTDLDAGTGTGTGDGGSGTGGDGSGDGTGTGDGAGGGDGGGNADTTTISPEEEAKQAEELRQQKEDMRTDIITMVTEKYEMESLEDIDQVTTILTVFTEKPDEVSREAIGRTTNKIDDVVKLVKKQQSEMSYTDLKNVIIKAAAVTGNVIASERDNQRRDSKMSKSQESTRKKRSTSDSNAGTTDTFVVLDELSGILSTTVVEGETPEDVNTNRLALSVAKSSPSGIGALKTPSGMSMKLSGSDDPLGAGNDSLSTVMSSFQSPYYIAGISENVTESSSVRLLFKGADDRILAPVPTDSTSANSLYIPSVGQPVEPVIGTAGYQELTDVRMIKLMPKMSISLHITAFVDKVEKNETASQTTTTTTSKPTVGVASTTPASVASGQTTTTEQATTTEETTTTTEQTTTTTEQTTTTTEEITTTAQSTTVDLATSQTNVPTTASTSGSDGVDNSTIPLFVYMKVGERVTLENYDYKFALPLQENHTAIYSSYSVEGSTTTYLPPDITFDDLLENTCFVSEKKLDITEETYLYIAVLYDNIPAELVNSTRKKRSVDPALKDDEVVKYNMSIVSAQCRFWDPNTDSWNTEGLEVGPLTDSTVTHCISTILSVQDETPDPTTTTAPLPEMSTAYPQQTSKKKYNPFGGISFSASFESPFNTFDPLDTSGWANLDENPLIFSVMVALWCFYLCCLIWARRWDLKDEVMAGASPLLDNDPGDSYLYELTVFTSSRRGAGTTAKVSMIFSGFEEETAPRLIFDDKRPVLQSGGIDSFLMSVPRPLGPLNHVRVWHDNSGKSPGWHFGYMCVVDLMTRDKYFFVCNSWLSAAEGDGAVDRVVPTATREDLTDFSHLFWTKARKDLTDSHIWFSVFGRPPKSVFTRVQRITCCLTLLFCGMCANILLYKDDNSSSGSSQSFNIGPLTLTLAEIQIGLYGSLCVFPINLLIVYIFRNSKHRESATLKEAKKRSEAYKKNGKPENALETNYERSLTNLKNVSTPKKKSKCDISGFLFPWWFQIVAYFLCLVCNAISFWITVSMGFQFGPKKSERWMVSFVTSFVESLLLSQPIKVILFAMFYALVIRAPTIEEELDNDPGLLQGEEYLHTHNTSYNAQYIQLQKSLAKYKVLPTPPQPEYIAAAKKRKQKENEMQDILREILAYVIFLYLLYSVSYGSKDPITWRMFRTQQNALEFGLHQSYGPMKEGPGYTFEKPLPMSLVGDLQSFWTWSKHTYIPYIYSGVDYAGQDVPRGATMDGVNFLVGSTRFRQLRVEKVKCPAVVYKYEKHCAKAMSHRSADKGSYGLKWAELGAGEVGEEGFTYQNSTVLEGLPIKGLAAYYEGGGYAYTLGRTQKSAYKAIQHLQENDWIDVHTRAIFIEFTVFNNQLNLYATSFIRFEMMPTGALYPTFKINPFRLERYQGQFGIMTLISELGIIAYTIFFMVKEIKLMKKQKKEYFKDFWNMVELLLLVLMLVAIAMLFYRFYLLVETSKRKNSFDRRDYLSFHHAAWFEESYLFLLAFITFIATAKFLKLLRFNKKMNVLGYTLLYIAKPFLSFMLTMLMVFVAYSHMAFLVFNTLLLSFSSFTSSMGTLFTLMLNKFDYKSMERANPIFAPFIFLTFTIFMGFMLVNFMLSLIIEGFTSVSADLEGKPNKYEIVDFVVGKFKAVMGFGSDKMPAVRDKKEDFVEDSQKELDMKFGEFSEKVFNMFLQDPEDIKTMKVAEDLINLEKKRKTKKKIHFS